MCALQDDDTVFVFTAEPSGDLYAYFFLKGLQLENRLTISGIGGQKIQGLNECGIHNYSELMTFGLASGLSSLVKNYRAYRKAAREMYRLKPRVFLAFAYPGINLLLARYAKKISAEVWYALPPQIWAWGRFRKYFITRWVDRVISFFPFEYRYYKTLRIRTELFENPLIQELGKYKRGDFRNRIGFMPGSRPSEIKRNLPVILEIVKRLRTSAGVTEFALILHPDASSFCTSSCMTHNSYFKIYTSDRYQAMRNCDALVTCSGTASLEAAIMGIPQVFFNRPSFLDLYLFRHFVTIKEFNLANLYYEKRFVPSYIGRDARNLANFILRELNSLTLRSNNSHMHKMQ